VHSCTLLGWAPSGYDRWLEGSPAEHGYTCSRELTATRVRGFAVRVWLRAARGGVVQVRLHDAHKSPSEYGYALFEGRRPSTTTRCSRGRRPSTAVHWLEGSPSKYGYTFFHRGVVACRELAPGCPDRSRQQHPIFPCLSARVSWPAASKPRAARTGQDRSTRDRLCRSASVPDGGHDRRLPVNVLRRGPRGARPSQRARRPVIPHRSACWDELLPAADGRVQLANQPGKARSEAHRAAQGRETELRWPNF